jgi:NAD(P)H dehydrogenase (quinone)
MHKFTIIYHSRSHSVEKLASEIAIGIKSSDDCEVNLILCSEAQSRIDEINNSDAIIFGSPTYFGSLSSEMKTFFDSLGDVFMNKKWRDKVASAFTHSSALSGDKLMTLMQMMIFSMQNGMIWVGQDLLPGEKVTHEWTDIDHNITNHLGSWIGLMAQSDSRRGIELSQSDLLTARLFGKRIANVTKRLKNTL